MAAVGGKASYDASTDKAGVFIRKDSVFRNWITADGSSGFPAASGRYHLYVSYACPWAHRTLIVRMLKGLDDVIGVTVTHYLMTDKGWHFEKPEPLYGKQYLREIYDMADPGYSGTITVPVLWDKERKTIVNNESSEIIRMFNTAFNGLCHTFEQKQLNFYPEELHATIDELNSWIYPMINNGVYHAGFAKSQEAYEESVQAVFQGLDKVEGILSKNRYLCGDRMTEADIRLFTTLIRFDPVYHGHFKCNKRRLVDYPNLWAFIRDIYQLQGVDSTVNMHHIMHHYMESHRGINPYGIVSIGPDLDYRAPHNRHQLTGSS